MKSIQVVSNIICSLIIGISIIIGCLLIPTENTNEIANRTTEEISNVNDAPLLNIEQAAKYLNITKEQVNYIIDSEQKSLRVSGSFSGEMFPYFKINNEIYISKNELINWIKDVTRQRREYLQGQVLQ